MKQVKTEKGITLIEVLASLVILSFSGILIWNVYFQGFQFSQKAISENLLLQEVNIVITNLTKLHQTLSEYKLESNDCEIRVSSPPHSEVFTHSTICLELIFTTIDRSKIPDQTVTKGSGPAIIHPYTYDVSLIVTASDKNASDNKISINSILYRMKGVEYQ